MESYKNKEKKVHIPITLKWKDIYQCGKSKLLKLNAETKSKSEIESHLFIETFGY